MKAYHNCGLIVKKTVAALMLVSGLTPLFCYGQVKTLTKQQMLCDIDTLESIISKYCYDLPLLEKRTNTSTKAVFYDLRKSITDQSSFFDYVNVIRQGLNILNDGHTGITNKSSIKWYITSSDNYLSKVGNATLSDTLHADYFHDLIPDSLFSMSKSGFRAKYINGKYYNARPFTFNSKLIEVGEEIKTVDGENIPDFVNRNYSKMLYLMWDPYYNQWYSDFFVLVLPYIGKKQFTLNIGGTDILINSEKLMDNLQKETYQLSSSPKVYVLNDIMYIYMPMMMNWEWYVQEVKKLYNPKIKKVVFDLRGNGGGDDSVWSNILKHLIDKPFSYKYYVGMNSTITLQDAISGFGDIKIKENHITVSSSRTIAPDSSSVKFNGTIYILQDKYTYSAATAFVSAAMQNKEKMTVIGERSALISGYTFPALVFSLPHSRVAFKLGFSADLTGGIDNPYMDKVEIDMSDSPSDYFDKRYKYDCHNIEYINERDKLIMLVKNDTKKTQLIKH